MLMGACLSTTLQQIRAGSQRLPRTKTTSTMSLSVSRCCVCLPAQILICQNLRNNLQHPNEYLRGATLRFLCRIREEEILVRAVVWRGNEDVESVDSARQQAC